MLPNGWIAGFVMIFSPRVANRAPCLHKGASKETLGEDVVCGIFAIWWPVWPFRNDSQIAQGDCVGAAINAFHIVTRPPICAID